MVTEERGEEEGRKEGREAEVEGKERGGGNTSVVQDRMVTTHLLIHHQ